MSGLVTWATSSARMIIALIALSILAGAYAYVNLPKEGEPDIDIPVLFVSVPFPGISAEDSEKLLVRPLETALSGVNGLKRLSATAAEGYAGIVLEFELDWDRAATLADVRDKVSSAQSSLPDGVEQYSINEINFSEFPIVVVSLSGNIPERTMLRVAKDLQSEIESVPGVLEAGITGQRDEMLEVIIDPLKMEAYNVTAGELLNVVNNNNRLIAAGEVEIGSGAYAIKIPSAFDDPQDVYGLPVKQNGDSVITLGQLADIRLTFEDRRGTARYNGKTTVAVQVVKRKGENLISTVEEIRETVAEYSESWPENLQQSVNVEISMDNSKDVKSMVEQLEASVLTAVALVMIVVLASLGTQSAVLVGFAIPTSFLLTFALLAGFGISISNMVMFGLILAVGMLVDGAIVVVEYADKEIKKGTGPMHAYTAAATRMFWPIISSTATTLCAFLPMLFWPGIPGQFMRNLPITLIFVLSASLVVALIFLPVVGGVAGRFSRWLDGKAAKLNNRSVFLRIGFLLLAAFIVVQGAFISLSSNLFAGALIVTIGMLALSIAVASFKNRGIKPVGKAGYRRSWFGRIIHFISGNPIMPLVSILATIGFIGAVGFAYSNNNKGVEFFVDTEPERAIIFVRGRGNLSLQEIDRMVQVVEESISDIEGVNSIFAFAGSGGLNQNTGGASSPDDAIGQVQVEFFPWEERLLLGDEGAGNYIIDRIEERLDAIPGIKTEVLAQAGGPASSKPISLRLSGNNWQELLDATRLVREHFDNDPELTGQDDTLPLPGIDWQIDVDVEKAGRYGTDVTSVGGMVQLVTRGLTLGTMRTDSSDEEVSIRVRFPENERLLSTLDTLRVRTMEGLVPLSNFITRSPVPKISEISRTDSKRYFMLKSGVNEDVNPTEKIEELTAWLEAENPLPPSVTWEFTGDAEDQAESVVFLQAAGVVALGLMFVILLAQFNSLYNSVLVLVAVVLSTTGVLIGMMVMDQAFSVIMTGTGIVALAGIVVNNNIVLIDTYQEYSKIMPRIEAITRTAEARIRPVLLTTITTMAGLTPMMFGLSVDFINGGYTIDTPTSLWWKQLATAVVFGLGVATFLTLIITPSLLALRIWIGKGFYTFGNLTNYIRYRSYHPVREDMRLKRKARKTPPEDIVWSDNAPNFDSEYP